MSNVYKARGGGGVVCHGNVCRGFVWRVCGSHYCPIFLSVRGFFGE